MKIFLDTNIFIRFATADDLEKAKNCRELIDRFEFGENKPYMSFITLFEIIYLLQKTYNFSKEKTLDFIEDILKIRNLTVIKIINLERILKIYKEKNIGFADSMIISQMEDDFVLCTYDKKLSLCFKSSKKPEEII